MSKIWSGGASGTGSGKNGDFMAGDDIAVDRNFVKYEVLTLSAYQVQVSRQNIIPAEDSRKILKALLSLAGKEIEIKRDLEDVHGTVEDLVLQMAGNPAKNLRIFLSRNEQIHTDILLYGRDRLLDLAEASCRVARSLVEKREETEGVMPGYTHYRQGMVISLKSYFDYFAAIFREGAAELLGRAREIRSVPFGYGSGFGSLSDVDFPKVAEMLGMVPDRRNPQYASLKRGMDEFDLVYPTLKLLVNISRISHDLIVFSGEDMPVFKLPEGYATGSSLMANKRNPDFLELIQGYTTETVAAFNSLMNMAANRSSGYHRDFQISKKIMADIFSRMAEILNPLPDFFSRLTVDPSAAKLLIDNTSYATANAKALFDKGLSWKDSYAAVGDKIVNGEKLEEIDPKDFISISMGSVNELLSEISATREEIEEKYSRVLEEAREISEG